MIKTANLTANAETSISGLGGAHCRINNNTAGTLYASAKSGIVPGGDNVTAIPAGRGDYVVGAQGTVYLLSASGGSVQVEGTDVLNRPFDETAVASVAAVGNPVIMDGLQGGVPFSEIVVSGENIAGQKLTIHTCGKNLIPYPYIRQEVQTKGVTMVDNGDGTVTLSGTAKANIIFWLGRFTIKAGKYTVSGFNSKYKDSRAYVGVRNGQGGTISNFYETSNSSGTVTISEDTEIQPIIYVNSGATFNGDIAAPQLELGGTATAYEPYHGAQYAITPDSNPYAVPDDIRQQNGLNVVTASEGELSVTGVRKNAAIKKIWDKLDELTTAVIVSTADLSE